jgi:hypothetical protein
MSKITPLFILICVALLSACTNKDEAYYNNFRNQCNNANDKECCLSSVENAEKNNSTVYQRKSLSEINCPDGYVPDMNQCPDSYQWCYKNKSK